MHTRAYARTHAHTCAYARTHARTRAHTRAHARTYAHTRAYARTRALTEKVELLESIRLSESKTNGIRVYSSLKNLESSTRVLE